jgi:hypothetical protein
VGLLESFLLLGQCLQGGDRVHWRSCPSCCGAR